MFVMSAIAFLDRVNIYLPARRWSGVQAVDLQLGWVFSAFVLGTRCFRLPGGRLADRSGHGESLRSVWLCGAVYHVTALVPAGLALSLPL